MGQTKELFAEIRQQINTICEQVSEGEINPFEVGRELKYLDNCIKQNKEIIAEEEKEEFEKYTPDELKEMKICRAGGGYSYKYDHIPEWINKKAELIDIEKKALKALQAKISNASMFDEETGEEITPAKQTARKQSITYK